MLEMHVFCDRVLRIVSGLTASEVVRCDMSWSALNVDSLSRLIVLTDLEQELGYDIDHVQTGACPHDLAMQLAGQFRDRNPA